MSDDNLESEILSVEHDDSNSESSSGVWDWETDNSKSSSSGPADPDTSSDISALSDCSTPRKLLSQKTKYQRKEFDQNQAQETFLSKLQSELRVNQRFRIGGHINCSPDETCQCYHCDILNTTDDVFNDNTESLDAVYISWMDNDRNFYDTQNKKIISTSDSDSATSSADTSVDSSADTKDCIVEMEGDNEREIQDSFEDNLIRTSAKRNGIYESTKTGIVSFGQALACIWRFMMRKLFRKGHRINALIISKGTSRYSQFKDETSSSRNNQHAPNNISDINQNTAEQVLVCR